MKYYRFYHKFVLVSYLLTGVLLPITFPQAECWPITYGVVILTDWLIVWSDVCWLQRATDAGGVPADH